jgi:hypothetical protein
MSFTEPFVVVDLFGAKNANDELKCGILFEVKTKLGLSSLNYQYGYSRELNETLKQYASNDDFSVKKFPLVWLQQPFTIVKDLTGAVHGTILSLRLFICTGTEVNLKSTERMSKIFKPILYPIYYELMTQIDLSTGFHSTSADQINHTIIDRYFWAEDEEIIGDKVDCLVLDIQNLVIAKKYCTTILKSW